MVIVLIFVDRPDTATLCNELARISDWRKLGLYLEVQGYELDQIERSRTTEGCGRWKQEIFSSWLRRKFNASWGDAPTPDTLHLGCSYHLHSYHRFLSTWCAVMLKKKKKKEVDLSLSSKFRPPHQGCC